MEGMMSIIIAETAAWVGSHTPSGKVKKYKFKENF